jgi:tetratricopeptide (TPR) repeat protein
MKLKSIPAVLAAALILSQLPLSAADDNTLRYRQAVELYAGGMYDRALSLFESLPSDPLTDGYSVLCSIKMRSDDYAERIADYDLLYPTSVLTGRIRWENARLLFDAGSYGEASLELSKVNSASLNSGETAEYIFKCAYCEFSFGHYPEAQNFFTVLEALDFSEYTAPGRYLSGVIYYYDSKFAEAEACFWKASVDPRFTELAEFYIVDCEFNQKNYDFAVREGERIYKTAPKERRERLARIISESSLILGDNEKARQYYEDFTPENMNRKDYFYAGSVLYSVHDYQGAIDNYTRMGDRSDSLGQIANYHLANAYLRTRNQVAAMEAFRDASEADYDLEITEDAAFNYAKLALDLNKDTGGFTRYIKRWSTRKRGVAIYSYMALAALYDRDYAGAVEAYDNIDDLTPDMRINYTKANFLRGEQLFSNASYRDAIPYLRATAYYLPKTDRLNQLSRYWMAESSYRSEDYATAARLFTELYNAEALDGMEEGDALAYNVAYSYFKQKDYATAARWFDKCVESGNALYREDAMVRRADCDFGRRDYKAAIASYQKVMSEYFTPDNIYPYYQQAISYGLSGDRRRKVSTLLHVEDASPGAAMYSAAWYELGRAQMDQKNNNDAIRSFTHLRNTTTDRTYVAKALIGLGMVYRNMTQYDKALECYKQVVSDMPQSEYAEESMQAIQSIYQKMKRPDKFIEYVESNSLNASKTEEEKEKMYFSSAEQLYLSGSYAEAITSIQKFMDSYPQSSDMLQAEFYLAESYRATGEKEKACDHYAKAMLSDSGYSFAEMSRLRYAQLSYDLERYQDAYKGYSSLLAVTRMDENRTEARLGMMRSAYRSKDYASAISAADAVMGDAATGSAVKREAEYTKAKSCLATSRRDEAMRIFASLGANPSTAEGAEARYMVIRNLYDTGDFDKVESEVYNFSQTAGDQSYWLAKAYLTLGDSFVERGRYEQAKATFESIRDGYEPAGSGDDVGDNVRKKLERLDNLMKKE